MPQAEITRAARKQLRHFKQELTSKGVLNRRQLDDYIKKLPARRYQNIAGLIPHVFTAPNGRRES